MKSSECPVNIPAHSGNQCKMSLLEESAPPKILSSTGCLLPAAIDSMARCGGRKQEGRGALGRETPGARARARHVAGTVPRSARAPHLQVPAPMYTYLPCFLDFHRGSRARVAASCAAEMTAESIRPCETSAFAARKTARFFSGSLCTLVISRRAAPCSFEAYSRRWLVGGSRGDWASVVFGNGLTAGVECWSSKERGNLNIGRNGYPTYRREIT